MLTVAPTGSTNLVMRRSIPSPSSRQRKVMGRVAELGEKDKGSGRREQCSNGPKEGSPWEHGGGQVRMQARGEGHGHKNPDGEGHPPHAGRLISADNPGLKPLDSLKANGIKANSPVTDPTPGGYNKGIMGRPQLSSQCPQTNPGYTTPPPIPRRTRVTSLIGELSRRSGHLFGGQLATGCGLCLVSFMSCHEKPGFRDRAWVSSSMVTRGCSGTNLI